MSLIVVNNFIVKKLSLSLIAVNVIDYHFHLLQYMESPNLHGPSRINTLGLVSSVCLFATGLKRARSEGKQGHVKTMLKL